MLGDFAQNLAQNWADWYMNGTLFLEKLIGLYLWVKAFKFRAARPLPNRDQN